MPNVVLTAYTAEPSSVPGLVTISFMLCGAPPFPSRTVEVRNTAEAVAARDAYAKEAKATGKPLAVAMHMRRNERAPAGFRVAERGYVYVNLDKPEVAAEPRASSPADYAPREGSDTPWGKAEVVRQWAPGMWSVETASHGGFKLDTARNAEVPEYMRKATGWYEEDCEWCVVAISFPTLFHHAPWHGDSGNDDGFGSTLIDALRCLRNWYPDHYERFTGTKLAPGESVARNRNDAVPQAAASAA